MLLLGPTSQDEHIAQAIARGWRDDIVSFASDKLPRLFAILLVIFILQRIVLFFVTRLRTRADRHVGNFHRAAQLRTMASILRATSYGV